MPIAIVVGCLGKHPVTVIVDAVTGDVSRHWVHARVFVVAVSSSDRLGVIPIAIDIGEVGAVTVLIDAIVGDLGGARQGARVAVVTVAVTGGRAVFVFVTWIQHRVCIIAVCPARGLRGPAIPIGVRAINAVAVLIGPVPDDVAGVWADVNVVVVAVSPAR